VGPKPSIIGGFVTPPLKDDGKYAYILGSISKFQAFGALRQGAQSIEEVHSEIARFPDFFYVAEMNRRVVGYVVMTVGLVDIDATGNPFDQNERIRFDGNAKEALLYSMAVLSSYRTRLGIGRGLLARSMRAVVNRGVETVSLEVRVSNLAAISLYTSIGFKTAGIEKSYFPDNVKTLFK